MYEELRRSHSQRILFDGIRQLDTLKELRAIAGGRIGILFVYTPPSLAFQFYERREARDISFDDFLKLSEAPVEQEVKKMIGLADAVLYNWIGKPKYEQKIHQLMKQIQVSRRTLR
jgi:dephospho-CoA kinase